jgi:hypothetical protein
VSTTAPLPPAGSIPTGPIVGRYGVLGWWDGRAWVSADDGGPVPAVGGEEYQLVRLDEAIVRAVGSAPEPGCESPGGGVFITADDEPDGPNQWPRARRIAIAGVDNPRPRPVEVLDPASDVYRQAVRDVLPGLGIEDPDPDVVQVVRADLDGDGVAEVLVVAERLAAGQGLVADPGDYSIVLLRRAGGDSAVVTTIVVQSIADAPHVEVSRVSAVADLNGDGRMEVVLDGYDYEGTGTSAYELGADGQLRLVFGAGCGA